MRNTSSQLTEMDSLIKIYKDTVNDVKSTFIENLEGIGCTLKFADYLIDKDDAKIKEMSLSDIDMLVTKSGSDPDFLKSAYFNTSDKSKPFIEFAIDTILKIKEKYVSILDAEYNLEELENSRLDITRSFVEMLKSPEYRQARIDQVKLLREQAEQASDPKVKKDLLTRLDHIEKSQTFSFLNERLHKYGQKEARSIKESFFNSTRGVYTMNRYYERLERLKINRSIHGAFFNLEETYLPESYEPFNNFFLFHIIRWVSYVDPNEESDFLYMSSLLGALKDLVTGECTEEEKQTLLSVMKDFYSFFESSENIEYFKENNSNYKYHPDRIRAEELAKTKRKAYALKNVKFELGKLYEDPEIAAAVDSDPEAYLAKIMEEKKSMLDTFEKDGQLIGKRIGRKYETVLEEFMEYQEFLKKCKMKEGNENESGSETIECCDESESTEPVTDSTSTEESE